MIKYKKGDLLEAPEKYIAHGCNAQGVMGSGVAKGIKEKFPHAFHMYRYAYEHGGLKVGQVISVPTNGKTILNMITQENYGRDKDVVYVDYDGLRQCFHLMHEAADIDEAFAIPKIGAGLANGDWEIIEKIIKEETEGRTVIVYEL